MVLSNQISKLWFALHNRIMDLSIIKINFPEKNMPVIKAIFILPFFFWHLSTKAQIKVDPTEKFSIEEKKKTLYTFSINQLNSVSAKNFGDVTMVNSKGEEKGSRKNVKGVLLKDILSK